MNGAASAHTAGLSPMNLLRQDVTCFYRGWRGRLYAGPAAPLDPARSQRAST